MTALVETIDALNARLALVRASGTVVGVVPTMGALHGGHQALIACAREECGHVVVTIFVNPLQFDREDDLRRYPRTLDADMGVCQRLGVDVVFVPAVAELFRHEPTTRISVGPLGDYLCGARRPGHFEGVATVVAKLFNIVRADRAYFGQKDAQQLAIVRRLVDDLSVPVEVIGVPTVREDDGLALSSRNRHLSPDERRLAPSLYRALRSIAEVIGNGANDPARLIEDALTRFPREAGLRVEYLEVVDPVGLQPVARIDGPVLVAGAIWLGTTRLIDNLVCDPAGRIS